MAKLCIKCKVEKIELEFTKGKNRCKSCISEYNKSYTIKNKDRLREHRKQYYEKLDKGVRSARVRNAVQRSPEAFIRNLMHGLVKKSNWTHKKLNPAALIVEIDYDFLLNLYNKQEGKCAILGIIMTHEFNNLQTMSIDRIDSSKGYVPDNVQLVSQFINMAKRHHTNEHVQGILDQYFNARNQK